EILIDHVARLLTPHKRPRAIHFVDALPRNDMGKVQKKLLTNCDASERNAADGKALRRNGKVS
ncbi:MAG TPA: hypothetical protein VKJ07_12695, partial [Mycobacteriales bacterium]|nr:hypothetical protein [Mycobacteriales bacterium]